MSRQDLDPAGFSTRCVHAGTYFDAASGGACSPVFLSTSHRRLSPQERQQAGISDALVRVSVGIEDAADLLADFAQALDDG